MVGSWLMEMEDRNCASFSWFTCVLDSLFIPLCLVFYADSLNLLCRGWEEGKEALHGVFSSDSLEKGPILLLYSRSILGFFFILRV